MRDRIEAAGGLGRVLGWGSPWGRLRQEQAEEGAGGRGHNEGP